MISVNENGEFIKEVAVVQDDHPWRNFLMKMVLMFPRRGRSTFAEGLQEILRFKNSANERELSEKNYLMLLVVDLLVLVASSGAAFGFGAICAVCPTATVASPYVAGRLTAWTTAGYMK